MTPFYKHGFDVEDRICSLLDRARFTLRRDPVLDHKHKIDFVITSFPDNLSYEGLGVQVTTKLDDVEKMDDFWRASQVMSGIPKFLYMELENGLDLDSSGGILVLAAIMNFQLNDAYNERPVYGVTVARKLRFRFFDLATRIKQLREKAAENAKVADISALREKLGRPANEYHPSPAHPIAAAPSADELRGSIVAYYRDRGYGFLRSDGGNDYFFNINDVTDLQLRDHLNNIGYGSNAAAGVPVIFVNTGITKPGAKSPMARNVRR